MTKIITIVVIATVVVALAWIWYLPIAEAKRRQHPKLEAITVCTVLSLLLWPLWFGAMIWAHTEPVKERRRQLYRVKGFNPAAGAVAAIDISAESKREAIKLAKRAGMTPRTVKAIVGKA